MQMNTALGKFLVGLHQTRSSSCKKSGFNSRLDFRTLKGLFILSCHMALRAGVREWELFWPSVIHVINMPGMLGYVFQGILRVNSPLPPCPLIRKSRTSVSATFKAVIFFLKDGLGKQ